MPKAKRVGISKKVRFEVLHRDGFTCKYCGKTPDKGAVLNIDHVVPVSKGGTNAVKNLVTACFDCNNGKRDKVIDPLSVDFDVKSETELLEKQQEIVDSYVEFLKVKRKKEEVNKPYKIFEKVEGVTVDKNLRKPINDCIELYGIELVTKAYYDYISQSRRGGPYFYGIVARKKRSEREDYREVMKDYTSNYKPYLKNTGKAAAVFFDNYEAIKEFEKNGSYHIEGATISVNDKELLDEIMFDRKDHANYIINLYRKGKSQLNVKKLKQDGHLNYN